MANDYEVCSNCDFGALTSQFKKTKGICPKCKTYNVLQDREATVEEVAQSKNKLIGVKQ